MRGILIACGIIFLAAVIGVVLWLRPASHFGEPFGDATAVSLTTLSAHPDAYENKRVHVEGEIVRQCPATGHWFFLRQEDGKSSPIKIEMEDSTLPQRLGSIAIVEGRLQRGGDGWRIAVYSLEFKKG